MNPDIKAKWVAALRSGKYPQGKVYLNNDGKFCCLGVLCEILKDRLKLDCKTNSFDGKIVMYNNRASALPQTVQDFCNIDCYGSRRTEEGTHLKSLADLNDERFTFNEIADIIEREF